MSSLSSCYWCYRCNRSVRVRTREAVVCAECGGGFVERVNTRAQMAVSPSQQRSPPQAPLVSSAQRVPISSSVRSAVGAERQRNRVGGERTFHPVIVFRGPEGRSGQHPNSDNTRFNLHNDAGAGQGLRPLPPSMSRLLTGPGLERLFGQLGRVGAVGGCDRRPASKSAVDGLPVIKVEAHHVDGESQCAVCLEAFELDSDAREMPCKHLYHSDCILPWLSVHNSCPVCRHQLPTDVSPAEQNAADSPGTEDEGEETVGLTIWRVPGGGYAVGRLSDRERELPAETAGDLNASATTSSRTAPWVAADSRRNGGGTAAGEGWHAIRNFFSFFGMRGSPSTATPRRRNTEYSGNFNPSGPTRQQPAASRPWRHRSEWAFMQQRNRNRD